MDGASDYLCSQQEDSSGEEESPSGSTGSDTIAASNPDNYEVVKDTQPEKLDDGTDETRYEPCESGCEKQITNPPVNQPSEEERQEFDVDLGDDFTITAGDTVEMSPVIAGQPQNNISYQWQFGDGTSATGKTVKHTYSNNDVYTVTVSVTDNNGITRTKTKEITVKKLYSLNECKTYSSDTTLSAGVYSYDCVVETGVTVTAQGDTSQDSSTSFGGVKFETPGPIVVNGVIDASKQGYTCEGPGGSCERSNEYHNGGGGYGGRGEDGSPGYPGSTYGSASEAKRLGSGTTRNNRYGGKGRGAVWLDSGKDITIDGTIKAEGESTGQGGASGGAIRIEAARSVKGDGLLSAEGGDDTDGDGFGCDGGGGGRIYLSNNLDSLTVDVSGGQGLVGSFCYDSSKDGNAGTVYSP